MSSSLLRTDRVLQAALHASAALILALTLLCFGFLMIEALPALSSHGRGLFSGSWYPSEGEFGLAPMIVGSVLVTAGASLIAIPTGIAAAVFALFVAPPRASVLCRQMLLLGASMPSVVYGLWGLDQLVPVIAALEGPGPSLIAGTLTLALMILPTVALFSYGVLADFPRSEAKAAAALALPRFSTAFQIAIPPRRRGLAMAGLLGCGRALGETMAVLMVSGNVPHVPSSVFQPMRSLTSNIALEMGSAEGLHRAALFAGGMLLASAVLLLTLLKSLVVEPSHA
jgi:phosphate transport system permease protein